MTSCKEETDCMTEDISPMEPRSNIYEITYSKDIEEDGKMEFKNKTLYRHSETLFADKNSKGRITNFLFTTNRKDKWLMVFCGHYKFHSTDEKKVAVKLQVGNDEEDPIWLTIHIYNNGKVLLQGTEERLRDFATIFMNLKEKVNAESDNRTKITSFLAKTDGSKCQSKTDKSQGDNTGNQKQEEENSFTEDESNGRQQQRYCAGNQEGEKSDIKKEEKASNKTETI